MCPSNSQLKQALFPAGRAQSFAACPTLPQLKQRRVGSFARLMARLSSSPSRAVEPVQSRAMWPGCPQL